MFYRQESNQYITEGMSFTIDGIQYPSNWLNLSTPDEKAAIGLEEVTTANQPADARFYWVSESLEGAVKTYVNTAKDLDAVKATEIAQVKQSAYSILQPTDYVEVRNLRDPNYKPECIAWRDAVRSTASNVIAAIDAAADVDSIAAAVVIDWPTL